MVKLVLNQIYRFLFQGNWYDGKVVKVEPHQVSFDYEVDGIKKTLSCFIPTVENISASNESPPVRSTEENKVPGWNIAAIRIPPENDVVPVLTIAEVAGQAKIGQDIKAATPPPPIIPPPKTKGPKKKSKKK